MYFRGGHLRVYSYENTSHCCELTRWASQERTSAVTTIVRSTAEDRNELITWGQPQLHVYSNTHERRSGAHVTCGKNAVLEMMKM